MFEPECSILFPIIKAALSGWDQSKSRFKAHFELSSMVTGNFKLSADLSGEGSDDFETERFCLINVWFVTEAAAVIANGQREDISRSFGHNSYFAGVHILESVFDRIGDEFVHNECTGNRFGQAEVNILKFHLACNAL